MTWLHDEIARGALEHDAHEVLARLLEGTPIGFDGGEGVPWEIYRSIVTDNVKVRLTLPDGRVAHKRVDELHL